MNIWGISDVGAVRAQNQDAYYHTGADVAYPFAIVCDGMGGAKACHLYTYDAADE